MLSESEDNAFRAQMNRRQGNIEAAIEAYQKALRYVSRRKTTKPGEDSDPRQGSMTPEII
jgi:hypothetical protein